jgi:hypothetical protein
MFLGDHCAHSAACSFSLLPCNPLADWLVGLEVLQLALLAAVARSPASNAAAWGLAVLCLTSPVTTAHSRMITDSCCLSRWRRLPTVNFTSLHA